jgi:hypothetical protein
MRRLARYLLIPAYRPASGMRDLLNDDRKVAYGLAIYVLLGLLYTVAVAVGHLNGFGAVTEPWLRIPAEDYYLYQALFQSPFFIVAAVVFAGLARLAAGALRGKGSFESIVAVCAVGMTLPMLVTLSIPETALLVFFPDERLTPLGGFAVIPIWLDNLHMGVGAVWMLVTIVRGIAIAESVSLWKAVVIAACGGVPMGALTAVFIRQRQHGT